MNLGHIKLIRRTVATLLETATQAEFAGMRPPAEAALIRLEHRMAKAQYNQMLKEFERECGQGVASSPSAPEDDILG